MQALKVTLPELMGGSADLNPSTFTVLKGEGDFESPLVSSEGAQGLSGGPWGYEGRNLHFGVREHGMGSICNGLATHGGFIPYGATFLVFSDYMRAAVRLSAIMETGCVWVFTHDSIGLGEDGPTHQAVEHYAALRSIPHLLFIRPADANEVTWAWQVAIANRHRPTVLALTRQNVPTLDRERLAPAEGLRRGAYVLNPQVEQPDLILMASGSEVQLIVGAEKPLAERGLKARLVSMPSWELFAEQSRRIPRERAAGRRDHALGGGSGRVAGLAPLDRRARRPGDPGPLRRFGAGRAPVQGIWLHGGQRGGAGAGAGGADGLNMKIAVAADHAGFPLKDQVLQAVARAGHEIVDLGTYSTDPVDYPDYARAVGEAIQQGQAERAVLLCGSGVGACVAANKMVGVRGGVCHDTYSARQGVEHDDMNVLCLGARIIGPELITELVGAFLKAKFTGEERHVRRLAKIKAIEAEGKGR